jgi:hypothetical protein
MDKVTIILDKDKKYTINEENKISSYLAASKTLIR